MQFKKVFCLQVILGLEPCAIYDYGTQTLLGRGQVVRHRFLVPALAGSNPAAPAKLSF
jgi:hypothetical protein